MSAIFHSKQERQTNKLYTPTADTAYFVFTLNSTHSNRQQQLVSQSVSAFQVARRVYPFSLIAYCSVCVSYRKNPPKSTLSFPTRTGCDLHIGFDS